MRKRIHVCQSVSGALRNWTKKDWDALGDANGMTGAQAKEQFRILEFKGIKVVPFGQACDGFDYETGCPGHEEADET